MYRPPHFREDRLDVLHALIESHRLGTIVTHGADGLEANLVPFTLDASRGPHGTLKAHFAKANQQLAAFRDGGEAMVVFQGAESYITPSWYPTKHEHGKVVPTWNYAVVQAWGRPVVIEDPAWLLAQISELTDANEGKRPAPWAVTDAPDAYVTSQLKGIFGIEIEIARIEGKWKTSQNQPEGNRVGVAEGLNSEGAVEMAELVAKR
jgi:transcriptional regulator